MRSVHFVLAPLLLLILVSRIKCQQDLNSGALIIHDLTDSNDSDVNVISGDDDNDEPEIFKPSNEWQKIKPGHILPPGLHIRINLQTGEKEAKLMENSEDKSSETARTENTEPDYAFWKTEDGRKDEINKQHKKFSVEELRGALKSFKAEEYGDTSEEDIKHVRDHFRTIEDLKKEFSKLNINVKTDSEILSDQITKYRKSSEKDKVNILQDLEYLVHQYDTAIDFVKMEGLELLLPDMNSSSSAVRSLVAFVLGSAMQGNPKVQIAVLEKNGMHYLLRLVAFDSSVKVQTKALFALSCLLRQFPIAQQKFIESGGVSSLAELFKYDSIEYSKLQLKAVTLLNDLVTERQLAKQHSKDTMEQEKLRQYKNFHLENDLVNSGFCNLVPRLLKSLDYDTQEKVINAMIAFVHLCQESFSNHLETLYYLAKEYQNSASQEAISMDEDHVDLSDNDDYFITLYDSVTNLINRVEDRKKDEL